ncbi:2-oxoacid dehydrogenase subunit E1 [Pseudomonas antarctica]|uniref:2-oxoacid dehydrogenase subunit E1 n=1 Tax=Pseudomonas antarctica TaxID=219572 RepID=A0ABQ6ZRZ6_9PSED|nr:2-oxoacid dehydrogenase subunit E1 [Pseudomonas antarctica]
MNGFASAVNHTALGQVEQHEWPDALGSLVANAGPERARQILDHGMRPRLEHDVDEFYYVTLMNEN